MLETKIKGNYLSILGSDGTLRKTVPQETEGAVRRDYETSDGKTGTKYELVYKAVSGFIKGIRFKEGEYGTDISLYIKDDSETTTLSMNVKSKFGRDLMTRLPNVDFSKKIRIAPYAFEKDGNKFKGVNLKQDDKKIESFFIETVTGEDGKDVRKYINGYPILTEDWNSMSEDDRDIFSAQVRKFLVNYIKENVCTKFDNQAVADEVNEVATSGDVVD